MFFFGVPSADAQVITPDSSCANESTYRSTAGDHPAILNVINDTSTTFQLFWRDYDGQRVAYGPVAPNTTTQQNTYLTHPWVIADSAGTCYRFLVMTSLEQSVTIKAGDIQTPVAPPPTTEPLPTSSSSAVSGPAPPRREAAASSTGGGGGGGGTSPGLIAGVAGAAVGAGATAAVRARGRRTP